MNQGKEKNDKPQNEKEPFFSVSYNSSEQGPGCQIGPFRIEQELGRGGAGIVYLAHDTKLDRLVAIKSIPAELQANSTARARFVREAKLLASLSHPNIGVIHDIIEQTEGSTYLVLEYIPGQTLAERIATGPIKLQEALTIALQIAEAVATAHENDVIHRDLKPGNIKITPDDKVKVLDFGLAKIVRSKEAEMQSSITEPGWIIGTPAYMSPEQARGRPTDCRTDIWSFGCVLYEMLTGKTPFNGETNTDKIVSIIERDPDWERLPPTTPTNIRVLLRRCMAKDPRRRLQHMGDVVIEIEETLNMPPCESDIGEQVVGRARYLLWLLVFLCSLAGLAVGIITTSMFLGKSDGLLMTNVEAHTHRAVITLPENQVLGFYQATIFGLRRPSFALSPDGSRLVYVARVADKTQLLERLMNQYEVRPIPGTDGASSPFFSPDSQSIGFFVKEQLKIVSLRGGDPVVLCNAGLHSSGSWSDDGMIYFCSADRLSRVPSTGGNAERLGIESELVRGYLQVLPGGKAMLISSGIGAELVSLETFEKKLLVKDVLYARYVPTGHLVYVRGGALEAVPFNLTTLTETGPRVPVIEKVLSDSVYGSAQFDFSNNGSLIYVPGGDTGKSTPIWIDRQGKARPQQLNMPAQIYGTPKLSPDGKRLAILVQELQSNVHIYDIATGMPTKLTLEGNYAGHVWTPDGKKVVFSCGMNKEKEWKLFWAPADGSSKAESLYSSQHKLSPCSWYSDGKRLMLDCSDLGICVLSVDGSRELIPVFKTDFTIYQEALSPDGKYIAYASNKEGNFNVYVSPYPDFDWIKRISFEFGEEPIWSTHGDELFYRNRDKWMVVSISTEPEFKSGKPQVVFEGPYINVGGLSYDVALNGQRFVVLKPEFDDSQVRELHIVTNWFDELRQLAPSQQIP
jgi:Tol biopolymer transport system component